MTDKNETRKKRIITTKYPQQMPIEMYPVKFTQSLMPQTCDLREEILCRDSEGQSIRRIASELGMSFAQVVHILRSNL